MVYNHFAHCLPGIIYSDIGTSPLYVLNGIWPASGKIPSEEDVIGGLSAIVWSLTLLPLLKYVGRLKRLGALVSHRFLGRHLFKIRYRRRYHRGLITRPESPSDVSTGEGGTFALFQGLYPPEQKDFDADRTLTGDSFKFSNKRQGHAISHRLRWPLLACVCTDLVLEARLFVLHH